MAVYVWIVTGFVFLGSSALRGIVGQASQCCKSCKSLSRRLRGETADRKTIMHYDARVQTVKTITDCHGVDGIYTPWSSWSDCTVTCGNAGVQYHVRFCTERPPHETGHNCSVNATDIENRSCSKRSCPTPKTLCDFGLDLALVIDKSSSIGKKALSKLYHSFLPAFLGKFTISSQKTHVGIVLYSPFADLVNLFTNVKYQDGHNLIGLVKNLPPSTQWGTRVDRGLEMASKELYTPAGGDRPNRKNVLVLIGDGRTRPNVNLKVKDQISDLRVKTDIVALGYGDGRRPINMTQLREVAKEKVYNLRDSPNVEEAAEKVNDLTCALDGGYTGWGIWSVCSATCGKGVRVRVRTCSWPPPAKGGKNCNHLGTNKNVQPCDEGHCPKAPPGCENKKIDIGLIIDRSSSVKNKNVVRVKTFLLQLVGQFDVSPNGTHIGIILFSGRPFLLSTLGDKRYHTIDGLMELIQGIPNKVYSGTRTDRALRMADAKLFTREAGDRPDAPNVLMVMTDGNTRPGSEPFDKVVPPLTEEKGVKIIAFGVGDRIDQQELAEIGGPNVFHGADFEHLYKAFKTILALTCGVA